MRGTRLLAGAAAAVATATVPAPAALARAHPHVRAVRCLRSCPSTDAAQPGSLVKITGHSFGRGMRAVFQVTRSGQRASVATRVTSRRRASVVVPARARSGVLYVRDRAGRRSNRLRHPMRVVRRAPSIALSGSAFDGSGMWVWYVAKSAGGDPEAIIAQARAHGISTVFAKSSDGTSRWPQFSSELLAALKAGGLRVCAWQYVYGRQPESEAERGAEAVRLGADCLVVDAESQYEGRYAQAQRYLRALRAAIGPDYPVGLTSFPYVDYHPGLPYSVFLGPDGAQFNVPQVYWKQIGGGLDAVLDHTYRFNRPYGRPIVPLGQLYDSPPRAEVIRFRELVAAAGSAGLSWWDWQSSRAQDWEAASAPPGAPDPPAPAPEFATIARGAKGDIVVWAQQLLNGSGASVAVTGTYDAATVRAVQAAQVAAGVAATGVIDTATWQVLLRSAPAPVDWTQPQGGGARNSSAGGGGPTSARLDARRDELGGEGVR